MSESERSGTTEIELPLGLLGMPDRRRFALEATARAGFFWLRALDAPELVFVLVDPFAHFDGYVVDIGPADQADLGPFDRAELLVLTLVTVGPENVTTNLRGPIALNLRTGRGKQLVLSEADVAVRAPFDPFAPLSAAV